MLTVAVTPGAQALARADVPGERSWAVVAGAFIVMMVGFGAIYSYAAFADAIAAEFGVRRAATTLIYALGGGACFLVSAVSGPLADRAGARPVAMVGMAVVGFGFVSVAEATSLHEVVLGYGLIVGLGTGLAYVPALAAVQRAFVARRGLASGLAVSGIGLGTAAVPALDGLQTLAGGWRTAFTLCGPLAAILGFGGALLLGPPRHGSALPSGGSVPGGACFARAYAGTLLVSIPVSLPMALLAGTAADLGLTRREALELLAAVGLGTIAGRFVLGALADRLGRARVFLACCWGLSAAMLVWAGAQGLTALQGFALVFGVLQGGFVALLPAFVVDCFGAETAGRAIGVLYTGRGLALLVAPQAVAVGITELGTARAPIVTAAALGCVGTMLLARVASESRSVTVVRPPP